MKAKLVALLVLLCLLVPTSLASGQGGGVRRGVIDDETPFVRIPLDVPQNGSTIVADMKPVGESDLDTLLYLVDKQGNIVAENDDRVEKKDSSSLIIFPQADAGEYAVIATRYKVDQGDSTGDFVLELEVNSGNDLPEYNVSPEALQAAGFPELEPRPVAEWTILAYYGGDNDLEPGIMKDFDEFEVAGGSTDSMRIVALMDRTPEFTDGSGNWTDARLFEIGADVTGDYQDVYPPTLDTEPLADLGELNTGAGETLAQFLVWAIRHYPAQHYVIAFGSHGAGWQGLIQDDTSDKVLLSIPELQQAFTLATAEAGVEKFDMLINDACLMSSVEYFAGVSSFFDFALASPEVVVNPALDMTRLVEDLKNNPEANLPAIGAELVDLYIERDIRLRDTSDVVYLTHAVTDLNRFDPVVESVENFATLINEKPVVYSTMLGEVRRNVYTYTPFMGGTSKIDLGDFMERVISLSTDENIIAAAEDVIKALDRARLYENAGERVLGRISYYNIYFPDTSADFKTAYLANSPLQNWSKMLRNYYNAVTPQVWPGAAVELGIHLPIAPSVQITNIYPPGEASVMNPVNIPFQVVGRRIAYGDFTIDQVQEDGSARRLSTERLLTDVITTDGEFERINDWDPGASTSYFYWDGELPVISDGETSNFELLIATEEVAFLEGRYRTPGSETWSDVGVVFSIEENLKEGSVQRIINRSPESEALAVIDIEPGSEFQAYSQVVGPDGQLIAEPGNSYTWPEGGLTWHSEPTQSGTYNVGFLITAFGGTTGFDSQEVTINNDNIIPDLRRDNWPQAGFTIPRRADWLRSAFAEAELLVRTSNTDHTENITAYIEISGNDPETVVEGFLAYRGYTAEGESTATEVDGLPALEIAYSYETEAGTYHARALALFHPMVNIGLPDGNGVIFAAEVLEGTGDLDELFAILRDNIALIDQKSWVAQDESTWNILYNQSVEGREMVYQVPIDWYPPSEADGWQRYAPGADAENLTFAAITNAETGSSMDAIMQRLLYQIAANASNFEINDTRTYYGENYTWEAWLYTATRSDTAITGRLYATVVDSVYYSIWVETPDNEEADAYMAIFETVVDGFLVS